MECSQKIQAILNLNINGRLVDFNGRLKCDCGESMDDSMSG